MGKLISLFLTGALLLIACGGASDGAPPSIIENNSLITVRMLAESPNSYLGRSVRVRGFLIQMGPELNLTVDETGAAAPNEPYIIIHDSSLEIEDNGRMISTADRISALGCTDQFVELSGVVGHTLRGPVGIVKILTIAPWDEEAIGAVCFSSEEGSQ